MSKEKLVRKLRGASNRLKRIRELAAYAQKIRTLADEIAELRAGTAP